MPPQIFVASPFAAGGGRVIASPFQFYVTGEDRLRIITANSQVGCEVTLQWRFLTSDAKPVANRERLTPNSDRSVKTNDFELGVGFLLNLTAFASAGNPKMGQTFVIVQLIRGFGSAALVLGTLLQGYVSGVQHLAWPGSPIVSSTDGEPFLRIITGTAPGVGNDIFEAVPPGARWEVLSIRTNLTIGAAGTALPTRCRMGNAGLDIFAESMSGVVGGATTVNNVCYAQGLQQQTVNITGGVFVAAPIPPNRIPAGGGFLIHTDVAAAQVTWNFPEYNVREWLDP